MRHVPLEIPLALLAFARLFERHYGRPAGVQVLCEALDGPPLAGGVPSLEQDDDARPRILHPVLQFQQLDLKEALFDLVGRPGQAMVVGITLAPRVHHAPVRPSQDWFIVVIGLVERQLVEMTGKVDVEVERDRPPVGATHLPTIARPALERSSQAGPWARCRRPRYRPARA